MNLLLNRMKSEKVGPFKSCGTLLLEIECSIHRMFPLLGFEIRKQKWILLMTIFILNSLTEQYITLFTKFYFALSFSLGEKFSRQQENLQRFKVRFHMHSFSKCLFLQIFPMLVIFSWQYLGLVKCIPSEITRGSSSQEIKHSA